ncbi:MAG TPA: hypothetical protein VE173_15210, partial [Longimicrobiales bacterium]|nr:hypothetical protein [Longimicrobiales bacterium]
AVENDPFTPEREPPARRYRLPSERAPAVREEVREERPEAPDLRVVGAAAGGRGGAALVQLEGGEPRLLAMGESVGRYTLAAVDAESATLVGPAGRLRLPVTEPLGEADNANGRGRRGRNAEEERARVQEQVEQRMQQLQQIMRRLQSGARGRGGNAVFIPGLPPGGSVDLPIRIRVPATGGRGRGGGPPSPSDSPSAG